MLPAYADLWATTSPAPTATPEPALFLHGPSISADVQVIWRADVDPAYLDRADLSLQICPPSALEALPIPIWAARHWLLRQVADAEVSDIPEREPEADWDEPTAGLPALRKDGDEKWSAISADDIKPGDTIIVPANSKYGGCDAFGWNPESKQDVIDLGAEAHYRQRLKGVLRVTPATLANALRAERGTESAHIFPLLWHRVAALIADAEEGLDGTSAVTTLIAMDDLPVGWRRLLIGMQDRGPAIEFYDDDFHSAGFILFAQRPLAEGLLDATEDDSNKGADAVTDREASSAIGVEVKLADHLDHVEGAARGFARAAGLDTKLIEVVALAAHLHDLGKADPRFQADLYGKSTLARMGLAEFSFGPLLAKSKRTAGYRQPLPATPKGFRHEALSVALAVKHPAIIGLSEEERDLALWLIGTHHGYGRLFFSPAVDPQPSTESVVTSDGAQLTARADEAPTRLDQGWFELAARVSRRYGPWELARLESMLRLADHFASAEEQQGNVRAVSRPASVEALP
jgi:CRISPR-associated endonuclease/helicase Cas3